MQTKYSGSPEGPEMAQRRVSGPEVSRWLMEILSFSMRQLREGYLDQNSPDGLWRHSVIQHKTAQRRDFWTRSLQMAYGDTLSFSMRQLRKGISGQEVSR